MTMKTIDWLISQGRDPLEALLVPPPADIADMLAADEQEKRDKVLIARLDKYFNYDDIVRLRVLFAEYERKHQGDETQKGTDHA
jgi:hypothetical protein